MGLKSNLAFEGIELIDVNGGTVSKEQNQNGQTDGRLCCSHRQDKEHKDLALDIVQIMRERNKIHIHRQQHELNGHEDDDDVLAVEKYPRD